MFKKLITNLPYNPSLIDQVSFYAKRLRKESYVRRTGLVLVALTVFVQMFAVISPPQPTLAHSNNDLISGGVRTAEEAANNCRSNNANYGDILTYFNITCEDVAAATSTKIDSKDFNGELYIAGRLAYGKTGETPVKIGGKTYWLRKLKDMDNGSSKHEALSGVNKDGKRFYIIKDCGGGVTVVGVPPAPTPKCQWQPTIPTTDPKCFEPCPVAGKQTLKKTDSQCFEACPVKGKTGLKSSDPNCFEPCQYKGKETVAKNSANCFEPCEFDSSIKASDSSCKPCKASQTREDKTSCLNLSKSASNDTQKLDNADGTTAKSEDVITFSLTVINAGDDPIKDFVVQENISDTLDYSEVTTIKDNGTLDKDNILSWPAVTIKGGEAVVREYSVKVKKVIPSTPVSASDPGHFDQKMTNVYGNSITIKLPATTVKTIEITSRTLPNTGPGTGLVISFAVLTVAGYFFARTRLLAKELMIVKADNMSGGAF